ncbi:MAG: GNAT family N-acetyltransferase [Acidimicrobiales bacterium]
MSQAPPPVPLPDPHLADGNLVLRPWAQADATALAAAWADPDVARWTGVPERCDHVAAGRWIAGEADRRARGLALDLVIEVDGTVAGEIGLAALDPDRRTSEIGWWVGPAHRGRGLAASAARLLADWALSELFVDAVLARCHQDNPASGAVARAAGFVRAGAVGELDLWRCC